MVQSPNVLLNKAAENRDAKAARNAQESLGEGEEVPPRQEQSASSGARYDHSRHDIGMLNAGVLTAREDDPEAARGRSSINRRKCIQIHPIEPRRKCSLGEY